MIIKSSHSGSHQRIHVDMMPLIDSLFVLLAFFLMAISTMVVQKTLPITLPSASTAESDTAKHSIISVDSQEIVYLNDRPIALTALAAGLPSESDSVIIRADENVRQKIMVSLLDSINRAGISQVMIQTD